MRRTIIGLLAATLASPGLAAAMEPPPNLAEAILAQQRLTSAKPRHTGALNDLGNLLTLAGETEKAEEVYRRAVEISPDEAVTRYNLGLLLRQTGRAKAAMRELKTAVKLDPADAWGHYQLGVLLEEKGRKSDAVEHFVEAFLIEPTLTELASNPQLLDSRLLTRALTATYRERVALLESAPRQYEQPKRVTRLLVPEARAGAAGDHGLEDAAAEGPEEKGKRKRDKRRRKNDPPGGA